MRLSPKAKEILANSNYSFVSVKDDNIYTSEQKGISPILNQLKNDINFFNGATVADKVIGKAAAFLLIYGKAKEVYADIISEPAKDTLEKYNIPFAYGKLVPHIINRKGDGMCPMEKLVLNIEDATEAYNLLKTK